jgi:large subunit ribosomal protein L30
MVNTDLKMKKIRIEQVKSRIGQTLRQKRTLDALGLHKMRQVKIVDGSPQVLGMIAKVAHLLKVEEV